MPPYLTWPDRLIRRWRVGANVMITSDTYGNRNLLRPSSSAWGFAKHKGDEYSTRSQKVVPEFSCSSWKKRQSLTLPQRETMTTTDDRNQRYILDDQYTTHTILSDKIGYWKIDSSLDNFLCESRLWSVIWYHEWRGQCSFRMTLVNNDQSISLQMRMTIDQIMVWF